MPANTKYDEIIGHLKKVFTNFKDKKNQANGKATSQFLQYFKKDDQPLANYNTTYHWGMGVGFGQIAKCPYLYILDKNHTVTPTNGYYITIIFDENIETFYLTLNQGVSYQDYSKNEYEKIREFWLNQDTLKTFFDKYSNNKIDSIEFSTTPTPLLKKYKNACILYKKFQRNDFIACQHDFINDLDNFLSLYGNMLEIIAEYNADDFNDKIIKHTFSSPLDSKEEHASPEEKTDDSMPGDLIEFLGEINDSNSKSKGIVLFLGAGLSQSIGLPGWADLIYKLLQRSDGNLKLPDIDENSTTNSEKIKEYIKNYADAYILGNLVKNNYNKNNDEDIKSYTKNLHDILYDKKFYDTDNQFENNIKESIYKTIYDATTLYKTPIQAIVTYNYDNCLEQTFENNHHKDFYSTIFNEQQLREITFTKKLPVYHVHGFLPYMPEAPNPSEKDLVEYGKSIVLTETEYHHLFADFFNWTNVVQVKYLLEYTCVFMGFSLTDLNQRRLLESIANLIPDDQHHFVFLSSKKEKEPYDNLRKQLNEAQKSLNKKNLSLKTYIIDYENYNDINNILKQSIKKISNF